MAVFDLQPGLHVPEWYLVFPVLLSGIEGNCGELVEGGVSGGDAMREF